MGPRPGVTHLRHEARKIPRHSAFSILRVVQTNTPPVVLRFNYGCEPRILRVSLFKLSRLFWFAPGGGRCIYPPSIAASGFADFIALACPGETWYSHMPLLHVYVQVSASSRSSTLSPLDHAVTSRRQFLQHCAAKHYFKCSECGEEFVTESARDQVPFYPMVSNYVLTYPSSTMKQAIA